MMGPQGTQLTSARRSSTICAGMLTANQEGKLMSHAATTSRSIVKLSGRSVV